METDIVTGVIPVVKSQAKTWDPFLRCVVGFLPGDPRGSLEDVLYTPNFLGSGQWTYDIYHQSF